MLNRKKSLTQDRGTPMDQGEIEEAMRYLASEWKVIDNHHLIRQFNFRNFREALSFTNELGRMAEEEKHHPDILLKYGLVEVTLWTHSVGGLSKKDFAFASKIDADFSSHK